MECLDWQDTITQEQCHQVLPLCLHTDFWEWLRMRTSIPSRDPPPLPSPTTGCSWGLEHISQISDLISCVKPQITLGHLNSKPAEVKSWLSYIPPCPDPTSSAKSAQIACVFIGTSNNEQAQAKVRHRITHVHLRMEIRAHPNTLLKLLLSHGSFFSWMTPQELSFSRQKPVSRSSFLSSLAPNLMPQ